MKKILLLATVTMITYATLPTTSAQEQPPCGACNTTPANVQEYIHFIQQTTTPLGEAQHKEPKAIGSPFAGDFMSQGLKLTDSNILQKTYTIQTNRVNEYVGFLGNAMEISGTTTRDAGANMVRNILTIFKPKKQRDIKKISTLDTLINNTSMTIGRAGINNKQLPENTQREINNLLQQHSNIFHQHNLQGATYEDMIQIMRSMQYFMKNIISTNQQEATKNKSFNDHQKNNYIQMNTTTQNTIHDAYACVRALQCNQQAQSIRSSVDEERQQQVTQSKAALGTITTGIKRLKKAFNRKIHNLTKEEKEAIEAHIAIIEAANNGSYGGEQTFNRGFRSGLENIIQEIKKTRAQQESSTGHKTQTPETGGTLGEYRTHGLEEVHNNIIMDQYILEAQFSKDQTETITRSINTIHTITKELQECGEKFSETCELQCNNKGGVCRAQ